MAWLLDTNAWIQILKRPGGSLEQVVVSHSPDEILLCSIECFERSLSLGE